MTPWLSDPDVTLYHGDCLDVLRQLPDRSVHMCATSPPFYGLRDYGTGLWDGGDPDCDHKAAAGEPRKFTNGRGEGTDDDYAGSNLRSWTTRDGTAYGATCGKCGARRVDQQIGLEDTPDQWVERLVAVFREVRRVLRDDGTLWVEIGDSYASTQATGGGYSDKSTLAGFTNPNTKGRQMAQATPNARLTTNCKPKDLLGQPWLLAFALRADGWYLRSEIIWARPNPMPESVTDRPTKSHSTVFLLSKRPRYFYDADAIREEAEWNFWGSQSKKKTDDSMAKAAQWDMAANGRDALVESGRNARSVWQIPTQPTPFAHFATWPEALVRRMILAGTSERGCCPECGAPWTRRVLVTAPDGRTAEKDGGQRHATGEDGRPLMPDNMIDPGVRGAFNSGGQTLARETVGWSPSCRCIEQMGSLEKPSGVPFPTPIPCTVLDPFAGSATTMLVARNHGRHSIGIELNADYLQIAAKRLQQLSLLNT